MSKPPLKALEQIKNYCEKTQCRRCVFGEKAEMLSDDLDYVGCKLQQNCPCEWKIEKEHKGMTGKWKADQHNNSNVTQSEDVKE